jgi:Raf kinase inhibitor-like YbhB/YbcL family protein
MKLTTLLVFWTTFALSPIAGVGTAAQAPGSVAPAPQAASSTPARRGPSGISNLALTTTAFPDGSEIPMKYASSSNPAVSPELAWTNAPEGTVSYVLIFHDPDAALNKTLEDYLHWLVFNIPATTHELPEGVPATAQLPDGSVQAKPRGTSGGRMGTVVGYLGPGAPAGPYHHYTFDLYALDTKLALGPDATRDDVLKAMDGHILGKAVLIGRFHH